MASHYKNPSSEEIIPLRSDFCVGLRLGVPVYAKLRIDLVMFELPTAKVF